jgi:hypothetical protein
MYACKKSTYVVSTGQASIRHWTADVDQNCSSSVQSGPALGPDCGPVLWSRSLSSSHLEDFKWGGEK